MRRAGLKSVRKSLALITGSIKKQFMPSPHPPQSSTVPPAGKVDGVSGADQKAVAKLGLWHAWERQPMGRVPVCHAARQPSFSRVPVHQASEPRHRYGCQPATRPGVRRWVGHQHGTCPAVRHRGPSDLARGSTAAAEARATRKPGARTAVLPRASAPSGYNLLILRELAGPTACPPRAFSRRTDEATTF